MAIDNHFHNTIPVGPLKLAVLDSAKELGEKVNQHIIDFRIERDHEHKSNIHFAVSVPGKPRGRSGNPSGAQIFSSSWMYVTTA